MRRLLILTGLVGVLLFALLFLAGVARYGGVRGLYRRVRVEFAPARPVYAYVPTPLPTATARPGATVAPTYTGVPPSPSREATVEAAPVAQADPSPAAPTAAPAGRPSPTPTAVPYPAPAEPPAPTEPPAANVVPAAEYVELQGARHEFQTWNNCGPATLSMYLSYYGSTLTQEDVRRVVRPDPEDKHAGPDELAEFARSQGLRALVRVNGTEDRLRQLVSNGVPVMVPTWHEDAPDDGMGHYRLITGYDDAAREWIIFDSLGRKGAERAVQHLGLRMSYDRLYSWWVVFNRIYVVVYTDELAPVVEGILGEEMDDATMRERALATSRREVEERPDDAHAWFNLGSNALALGGHEEAAAAYDRARVLGLPWRMLWYQHGPFEAYYGVGRYEEVVALADATIRTTRDIEELHYWRGRALEALGDPAAAREAYQRAVSLRASFAPAAEALAAMVP